MTPPADSVDGTKIVDNAIDSEHYVDGSIDNVHLADDAVNSDELAAGSVDTAHIAINQIDETLMKDAFVGDFSDVTITAADTILYGDATDSGNTKKDTVQGILDLAGGGGKINQVIFSYDVTAFTHSSATYTDTGLTGTITPSATDSRMFLSWEVHAYESSVDWGWGTRITRNINGAGATTLYTAGSAYEVSFAGGSTNHNNRARMAYSWMDTDHASSGNPIVYNVQVGTQNGPVEFNGSSSYTNLTIWEILA